MGGVIGNTAGGDSRDASSNLAQPHIEINPPNITGEAMNKLCINCGSDGKSVGSYHNAHESARYILCPNCGTTSGVYPTKKEAWKEWNDTYIAESKALAVSLMAILVINNPQTP